MNIILVGFMGTGKTAVGKELASRLKMRYVSTDEIIVDREKREINEIFLESGEPYFRRVEKEVVKELSRADGLVIDTGGGVVLDRENVDNLKESGVVVCLKADPGTIYERTKKGAHRPLLNVSEPEAEIRKLLDSRSPFYARADRFVDTAGLTVAEVAERIIGFSGEGR